MLKLLKEEARVFVRTQMATLLDKASRSTSINSVHPFISTYVNCVQTISKPYLSVHLLCAYRLMQEDKGAD